MRKLNLVVFGDYPWTVSFLKQILVMDEFNITHVYTSGKKPRTATEDYFLALSPNDIELRVIDKIDNSTISQLRQLEFDLILSVAFSKIFNQAFLDVFKNKVLNIHPSPLPYGRGPDPIRHAILNGDQQFGVTLHLIDYGIDTGHIVGKWLVNNDEEMDCGRVLKILLETVVQNLSTTLSAFLDKKIIPEEQTDSPYYASAIDEKSLIINKHDTFQIAMRKARACMPFRLAKINIDGNEFSFSDLPHTKNFEEATKFSLAEVDIYLKIDPGT